MKTLTRGNRAGARPTPLVHRLFTVFFTLSLVFCGTIIAPVGIGRAESAAPQIDKMTTEHLVNPVGIDIAKPRFSWTAVSSARAQKQSAYALQVSEADPLFSGALAWDTGIVESPKQTLVEYDGSPLKSATVYYWRVKTTDANGIASDWSETASFTTAIMDTAEWSAAWIAPATNVDGGALLRGQFELEGAPASAYLYVAGRGNYERGRDGQGICCEQDFGLARGIYQPYVNGIRVGDAEYESQMTDTRIRSLYRTWDVTEILESGTNVVGIEIGEDSDVIAQLRVTDNDGNVQTFTSDGTWKSHKSATVRANRYNGETYDFRLEQDGWQSPDFDASEWQQVRVEAASAGTMTAAPNEPMRVINTISPLSITNPAAGVYVFDFGQNISGRTRISTNIADGASIAIKHGERITNGRVDNGPLSNVGQTTTLIGNGEQQEYAAQFTYQGFRWVEISGLTVAPTTETLIAEEIHSDVALQGTFDSDNELFNALHVANVQTQVNGLHGFPEDTPTREKRGWMADAHIAAEATISNRGMAAFYTKWVTDIRDAAQPSGLVPDIVPNELGSTWMTRSDPAWGAAAFLVPYYAWKYYGDERIVAENYEMMKKYVQYVGTRTTDFIVTNPTGTWGNDWVAIESTDSKLFRTGFYYWGAATMEEFANILGRSEDAASFGQLKDSIANAFNDQFFDGKGSYGASQFANALPLTLGLVPDGFEQAVAKTLVSDVVDERANHFTGGLPGIKYIPDALEDFGFNEVIFDVVQNRDYPGWGYMLDNGPGTIWEHWDGVSSLNHPMFTGIDTWLYTAVAGISQAEDSVGYEHLVFAPKVTDRLSSASATRDTRFGTAGIDWSRSDEAIAMSVTVPYGATATVTVPGATLAGLTESGIPVREAAGVTSAIQDGDGVRVEVGSGAYSFASDVQLGHLAVAREAVQEAQASIEDLPEPSANQGELRALAQSTSELIEQAIVGHVAGDGTGKAGEALTAAISLLQATQAAQGEDLSVVESAALRAVDALSRFMADVYGVKVAANTPSSSVAPGNDLPLTIKVTNSGSDTLNALNAAITAPPDTEATEVHGFSSPTVAAGEEQSAEYLLYVMEAVEPGSLEFTVQIQAQVGSRALLFEIPVRLAVSTGLEVQDVSLQPSIVEPGGHGYVRASVTNTMAAAEQSATVELGDLPTGWSADPTTPALIAPAGYGTVGVRVKAGQNADSGVTWVTVKDQGGAIVAEQEVLLLVRGSRSCGLDPSGSACLPDTTRVIANFEKDTENWEPGENSSSVNRVDSYANRPGTASLGSYVLEVLPAGSPAGSAWRSAKVTFPEPVAVGGAHSLLVDINGYGGLGQSEFWGRVTVTSVDGHMETVESPVSADAWQTVSVPLESLAGSDIASIEVSFRSTSASGWAGRFQIDAVRLESGQSLGENLALRKSVAASSPINCCGWENDKLTDGVRISSSPSNGFSSDPARPTPDHVEWVSIDLQSSQDVGTVVVYPRTAQGNEGAELTGRNFPRDFEIQVSDNGNDWTAALGLVDQEATNGLPKNYTLPPGTKGRYLRIYATKLGPGAPDEQAQASGGHRLQLAEVEAYAPVSVESAFASSPQSHSVIAGEDARFTALASGYPTPMVYWQKAGPESDFDTIESSVGTELILPSVTSSANGSRYRACIVDSNPLLCSEEAVLFVDYEAPGILADPTDAWVWPEDPTAQFTSEVVGSGLAIAWQRSVDGIRWRTLAETSEPSLVVQRGGGFVSGTKYRVIVSNLLGEYKMSEAASLQLFEAPTVALSSTAIRVAPGSEVQVSAQVSGAPAPDLQWFMRDGAVGEWTAVDGATADVFSFTAALSHNGKQLAVKATSEAGEAWSEPVGIVVKQYPGDQEAPTVTHVLRGQGNNGWLAEGAGFALLADDKDSGVASIEYKVGDSEWRDYTPGEVVSLVDGRWTIAYRATDNAENTSEEKAFSVSVDSINPGSGFWRTAGQHVVAVAVDGGSGLESIEFSGADGKWRAGIGAASSTPTFMRAADRAGNQTEATQLASSAARLSAAPGDQIGIEATGFAAGTKIRVEMHSDPVVLATVTANEQGNLVFSGFLPDSIAAGDHEIVLVPLSEGGKPDKGSSVTVPVQVIAATGAEGINGLGIASLLMLCAGAVVLGIAAIGRKRNPRV